MSTRTQGRVEKQTDGQKSNEVINEDHLRKKKTASITVNGVDIMEIQRRKNDNTKEKTQSKVKTTPGRKKTLVKTTPSSDTASKKPGQMLKYVTRLNKKTEDNPRIEDDRNMEKHTQEDNLKIMKTTQPKGVANEDNQNLKKKVKMTFTKPPTRIGVRERVNNYENNTSEKGCLFLDGMCMKHKVSLIRHIKVRKMSVVSDGGDVSWTKNEFTALMCPSANQPSLVNTPESAVVMSSTEEGKVSNKKPRILSHVSEDQSTSSNN